MANWNESKHPRDWRGRFASVGSRAKKAAKAYGPAIAIGAAGGAYSGSSLGSLYPKGPTIPVPRRGKGEFDKILRASGYKVPRTGRKQVSPRVAGAAAGAFLGGLNGARVAHGALKEKRKREASLAKRRAKAAAKRYNSTGKYYK